MAGKLGKAAATATSAKMGGTMRLLISAGEASPSPPLGPALGQVSQLPHHSFMLGLCSLQRCSNWALLPIKLFQKTT